VLLSSNIPVQELVVDFIASALPQAHQIYCVVQYTNGAIQVHTEEGEYTDLIPDSLPQFLNKGNTGWYALNETPFSRKQQIGQTSLEMELDRDFLFLKNIPADDCRMFLFVQLKPFGLTKEKYLLSDQKKQFEISIKGFVTKLIATVSSDKILLKNIAKGSAIARNEIRETKKQLTQQGNNFEVAVTQFIQLIVNKLQEKHGIVIRMSNEFIDELKDYSDPFENLESNLESHIQIELNLALAQGESEIILTPTHLTSLNASKTRVTYDTEDRSHLGRFAKTYKLLDRYENAAELAQRKGLSIIGKHIGNHCTPPVSNASITDALNKQAKKVYELFDKYPNKWSIIRSEFKSVANIMEKESARRQEIA
jgi:hypothetical protein